MGLHNYCKKCCSDHKKLYCKNNAEYIKAYKQRPEIKQRRVELDRERYKNDPEYRERRLRNNRLRRRKEPAKLQEKFKLATDIEYKLKKTLRKRVLSAIKKVKNDLNIEVNKCAKTLDLLGCSLSELKIHLENQFTEGMNWQNHGYGDDKWHIDHIRPCASFDLTDPEQQKQCFHYTNLQPLWQKDNLIKKDKIIF